jgi:hypothetical protein
MFRNKFFSKNVSKYLVLGTSKLTFLESVSEEDSLDIHHDHIQ